MTTFPFVPLVFDCNDDETIAKRSKNFLYRMESRRTVRDYSPRKIPKVVIENAIRTAGTAPSGANMQPWHFVVVTKPEIRTRIRKAAEAEEHEFYTHRASREWLDALAPLGTNERKPFLESASCLIAIFLKKFSYTENGTKLKNYYPAESVGIASGLLIASLHYAGVAMLTHTPSPMRFFKRDPRAPKVRTAISPVSRWVSDAGRDGTQYWPLRPDRDCDLCGVANLRNDCSFISPVVITLPAG